MAYAPRSPMPEKYSNMQSLEPRAHPTSVNGDNTATPYQEDSS